MSLFIRFKDLVGSTKGSFGQTVTIAAHGRAKNRLLLTNQGNVCMLQVRGPNL